MKKNIGVYVHIPFCKSKCYYCDFVSFSNKDEYVGNYVKAVIEEIRYNMRNKYNIETIYIGGGTPSIIEHKYISEILKELIPYAKEDCEITIEVNPGTVNEEKLKNYIKTGINRISVGLQSTNDNLLKEIGRIHNYKTFLKTYKLARSVGFKNINVDLMLALPNQTIEDLEESLNNVINLNPEHISVYSLILEENTRLFNIIEEGKLELPNETIEREMYWKTKRILEENGYVHYEISNFAKEGFISKHNCDCWEQKEYLGIGVAAHSYLNKVRYSNTEKIEEYIENINNRKFADNRTVHEIQNNEDEQKEYIMLGLRKIDGISINKFKEKFNINPLIIYNKELNKLVDENLLKIEGDKIRLTDKGLDLANLVFEEFI